MTDRILDLSEKPASLCVRNELLILSFDGSDSQTVPLSDLAVVIASHPQIQYTQAVLSGLAQAGASFVVCDQKHLPVAMLLPLATHSLQTERYAAQARLPLPTRKRLWQQIVRAKIAAQGRFLDELRGHDFGLSFLLSRVRSGDPENLEARAARSYWRALFLEQPFRRDPDGDSLNPHLNYGYAVLRAIVARSICGAGLHPSFGLHHHNRYDTFCLADDLMEPFRPIVDKAIMQLAQMRGFETALDRFAKQLILQALLARFPIHQESRTLFDWVHRVSNSLARIIEGGEQKLEIPAI